MTRRVSLALVGLAGAFSLSACSVIMPEQTLVVTTPEAGADVYLALHGDTQIGVNSMEISGAIPTGQTSTDFAYIGETPLTHTFYTTRYQQGLSAPGIASTNQSTFYREAVVRVVYEGGVRDERRVRINNASITLNFDGPEHATVEADTAK